MISTCPRCHEPVSIPPDVDAAEMVCCPLCDGEYPLIEVLAFVPPELTVVSIPTVETISSAPEVAEKEQAGMEEPQEADFSEENEAAEADPQFPAMPATAQRRVRKPKSSLQTLIEVVSGGLAGCLVAYYGLAFWFGPQFRNVGLPKLPLPGISWITAEKNDPAAKPVMEEPAEP